MNTRRFEKRLELLEKLAPPPGPRQTATLLEIARGIWNRNRDEYRRDAENDMPLLRFLMPIFEREDADNATRSKLSPQRLAASMRNRRQAYKRNSSRSPTKAGTWRGGRGDQ